VLADIIYLKTAEGGLSSAAILVFCCREIFG
jgi:hypothetical protein